MVGACSTIPLRVNRLLAVTCIYCVMASGVVAQSMQAAAVVRADVQAVLTSPIEDVITSLPISLGTTVTQGDTLVTFDCGPERARLDTLQAEVALADHDVAIQLDLQRQGATGRASVERARLELRLQNAKLGEHEAALKSCTVTAPFDGVVSNVSAGKWQTVTAGAPLFELTDPDALYIEIVLPSSFVSQIKLGDEAAFRVEGQVDPTRIKISRIGVTVDLLSQTTKLHATFVDRPEGILVGASGIVELVNEGTL